MLSTNRFKLGTEIHRGNCFFQHFRANISPANIEASLKRFCQTHWQLFPNTKGEKIAKSVVAHTHAHTETHKILVA